MNRAARRVSSSLPVVCATLLLGASAHAFERAPTLRVQELRGKVASQLAVGNEIAPDSTLSLARGDVLTLALDDHVRLHLTGPLLARALPDRAPALLLREGSVSVEVSPRGRRDTAAFWLATPAMRLDVADSARFFVRASARGTGVLAVVSGHVQYAQPKAPELWSAVTARCVTHRGVVPLNRPFETLEQAVQTFSRGPSCDPQRGVVRDVMVAPLARALAAVEERSTREVLLLAEHSRLVAVGDKKAEGIRGELARSAAILVRERRWASAQRARREASILGEKPTRARTDELERARALAPYTD